MEPRASNLLQVVERQCRRWELLRHHRVTEPTPVHWPVITISREFGARCEALGRIVATVVMSAGIGFVALLTGALAQRFLYGASEGAASEAGTNEADITKKLDEMSVRIARLQQTLEE